MPPHSISLISFVIPVFNEEQSIQALAAGIEAHVSDLADEYEIIFVDDGSTDGSAAVIETLTASNPRVRLVQFATNYGKAEALGAGFRRARGEFVISMDADLQDDPCEIPRFVDKLNEGFDLVSGWKAERHDPWHKTIPSTFFNFVVSKTFALPLHDFNCGYKAYRRPILDHIHLYGELHRFIPAIAKSRGARIAEIPVKHNPRRFGKSKYGLDRLLKGFLDLITVLFTTRYLKRPLHFFGTIGIVSFLVGSIALGYLAVLWSCGIRPIGNRPLLFYGILMAVMGVQIFSLGILAELFVTFNQEREGPSIIRDTGADPCVDFPASPSLGRPGAQSDEVLDSRTGTHASRHDD